MPERAQQERTSGLADGYKSDGRVSVAWGNVSTVGARMLYVAI